MLILAISIQTLALWLFSQIDIYRARGKGGGGDTRASRLVAMLNRLLYIYFISSENINTLLVKCIEPYLCTTHVNEVMT